MSRKPKKNLGFIVLCYNTVYLFVNREKTIAVTGL